VFFIVAALFVAACLRTVYVEYQRLDNPPTQFEVKREEFAVPDFTICPSQNSRIKVLQPTCEFHSVDGKAHLCEANGIEFGLVPRPVVYAADPTQCRRDYHYWDKKNGTYVKKDKYANLTEVPQICPQPAQGNGYGECIRFHNKQNYGFGAPGSYVEAVVVTIAFVNDTHVCPAERAALGVQNGGTKGMVYGGELAATGALAAVEKTRELKTTLPDDEMSQKLLIKETFTDRRRRRICRGT
jgi:hypothetical protein